MSGCVWTLMCIDRSNVNCRCSSNYFHVNCDLVDLPLRCCFFFVHFVFGYLCWFLCCDLSLSSHNGFQLRLRTFLFWPSARLQASCCFWRDYATNKIFCVIDSFLCVICLVCGFSSLCWSPLGTRWYPCSCLPLAHLLLTLFLVPCSGGGCAWLHTRTQQADSPGAGLGNHRESRGCQRYRRHGSFPDPAGRRRSLCRCG